MKKLLNRFSRNRGLRLLLLCEILLAVILVQICSQKVSLNSDDDPAYHKDNLIDKIECANGQLKINNVTVKVPATDNISYDVSYVWSPEDTDYPSKPHTAIASYRGSDNAALYDISIYRDSYVPKEKIKRGQDASSWFESWNESESENGIQTHRDSGDIHGFYITSISDDTDESAGTDQYETASYYFAVNDTQGIMIYILEGILYNAESMDEFTTIMDDCIDSIKIKQQTKASPAAGFSKDSESNPTMTT